MSTSLAQIHTAVVDGLRAKLTGIPTVDAYPVIAQPIPLPAVLVELSKMEPGDDPGTGETALLGHFQARAIVDPNAAEAYMQVRELAARIAVAITHEIWGLEIEIARLVQIVEDSKRPELDGYLVWLVEWTQEFHLGEQAWPYEDSTDMTLMIGLYPGTGPGNEDRYMGPDYTEPPPGWGTLS